MMIMIIHFFGRARLRAYYTHPTSTAVVADRIVAAKNETICTDTEPDRPVRIWFFSCRIWSPDVRPFPADGMKRFHRLMCIFSKKHHFKSIFPYFFLYHFI